MGNSETTNAAEQSGVWVTGIQEGYRTKTVRVGNCTVHIHRPILEPAEQAKREDEVRRAILSLGA